VVFLLLVREIMAGLAHLGFPLHQVAVAVLEVLAGMELTQPLKQEMVAQVFAQL